MAQGKRRSISKEGYLFCPSCETNKHISEFYQRSNSVWFIQDMPDGSSVVYGKPYGYCKMCQRARSRDRQARLSEKAREARIQADLEWEKAVEEMGRQGFVLVKDRDGTVHAIPKEDWER